MFNPSRLGQMALIVLTCALAAKGLNRTLECQQDNEWTTVTAAAAAANLSGATATAATQITTTNLTAGDTLSRRKRYLAFPDGSSVSASICMTIGVIGNPNVDYLSWAVNWGVSYDLPNHNWVREHANGFVNATKAELQRRSRRSFYDHVQLAFENMGFNGRACVARALCESAKYLRSRRADGIATRGNMLEEIVKTIFSLPSAAVAAYEPNDHHHYDRIYRRSAREVHDCNVAYPGCHFSLLELALGKYATTPPQYGSYMFM